jgi:hypothetical protein
MALTLERTLFAKQRCLSETRDPFVQLTLKTLFTYLDQHKRDPDLQFVPFGPLAAVQVAIADVPCRIYAIYLKMPTTSAIVTYFKLSNGTTGSQDGTQYLTLPVTFGPRIEECITYGHGLPMTTAATIIAATTPNGAVAPAAANQPSGFILLGGPA